MNGQSFLPKIFTDTTGKFVIDFDPGTSAILTPKLEDHLFVPAFWEVTNISSPIVGILFNDITTRKISGQVAGNEVCRKSIIADPPGTAEDTRCRVQVRTTDGCLEREILIDNQEGFYEFDNLPPSEKITVSIIEHSNQKMKQAFDVQGGYTVDLTKRDSMDVDFIYTAPPDVEITSGLDTVDGCTPAVIVLPEGVPVILKIKPYEQYEKIYSGNVVTDDGVCYVDTAEFHIINGFGEEVLDTAIVNGILIDTFQVGSPNPSPPFMKTLQIVVKSVIGQEGSLTKQGIVTGTKEKLASFTSLMPEIPTVVLRDPPGDGSYSFFEKGEKFCKTTEMINDLEIGFGGELNAQLGTGVTVVNAPLGIGVIQDFEAIFDLGASTQVTYQRLSSTSFETCLSVDSKIFTSADDLIVGSANGGDIYMGEAINIIFGRYDAVTFDECEAHVEEIFNVEPGEFATVFVYSEFYITGTLIPSLTSLYEDPDTPAEDKARYQESISRWEAILANNHERTENANFLRNISFDAGTEYEYSETSDTASAESIANLVNADLSLETTIGFNLDGNGLQGTLRFVTATSNGGRDETGSARGISTGYVLGDDDPLDAFTVDIGMDSVYKTPVFNLKAGQSSCPWEPGTANREGTNIAVSGVVTTIRQ